MKMKTMMWRQLGIKKLIRRRMIQKGLRCLDRAVKIHQCMKSLDLWVKHQVVMCLNLAAWIYPLNASSKQEEKVQIKMVLDMPLRVELTLTYYRTQMHMHLTWLATWNNNIWIFTVKGRYLCPNVTTKYNTQTFLIINLKL